MKVLAVSAGLALLLVLALFGLARLMGENMAGEPLVMLDIAGAGETGVDGAALSHGAHNGRNGEKVVLDIAANPGALRDDLLQQGEFGPLPIISPEGETSAIAYARPVSLRRRNTPARIALVLMGMGLDLELSRRALEKLPKDISLAFSPYGRKLAEITSRARRAGHELILQIPLEPENYPRDDPGPKTLFASQSFAENAQALYWSMARFGGYFAVTNLRGRRFLSTPEAAGALFGELKKRGLYFFHDSIDSIKGLSQLAAEKKLGYVHAHVNIDKNPNAVDMGKKLHRLEEMARRKGLAIGVFHMHPASIDMVARWTRGLKAKGIALVPASSAYVRHPSPNQTGSF